MPPQPHPPVAEGAWLRPRPARQSPDCRRGRVHRHASRRPKRVRLKAAAFPAQHIRSALSQCVAVGAAHRRLRRIPAGSRGRMRRGLPSPGSVGIPPFAGSAASRLPPSASPAVTASASCRRPSSRSAHPWHGEGTTIGDPAKDLFFNGFVGSVPTVAVQLENSPAIKAQRTHLAPIGYPPRNYGPMRSPCSHTTILRAINAHRASIAHRKGRGTRTAETDMCN